MNIRYTPYNNFRIRRQTAEVYRSDRPESLVVQNCYAPITTWSTMKSIDNRLENFLPQRATVARNYFEMDLSHAELQSPVVVYIRLHGLMFCFDY